MHRRPSPQNSLARKVFYVVILFGVVTVVLSLAIRLSIIKKENQEDLGDRVHSFSRVIASSLIQTLDSGEIGNLYTLVERLLVTEEFDRITLRLNTGDDVEVHEFTSPKSRDKTWASVVTKRYTYPYSMGIAEMEVEVIEPFFSGKTLSSHYFYNF